MQTDTTTTRLSRAVLDMLATVPDTRINVDTKLVGRLAQDALAYMTALEQIRRDHCNVCPDFDICDHADCRNAYDIFVIVDAALKGEVLP